MYCCFLMVTQYISNALLEIDAMTNDEYMIECKVERMTDKIDARYMNGEYSDSQYREEMKKIDEWAEIEYRKIAA